MNQKRYQEYARYNWLNHIAGKQQKQKRCASEASDYFPFVYGDIVEQHQKDIRVQLRLEARDYFQTKRKQLIKSQSSRLSKVLA